MTNLGRLERVELRSAWPGEALDFTPWLAKEDNLALLSETLGLELELDGVEKRVGTFKADILCRDTVTGAWVLVENQLERTDHKHLGQLITYAAGLDAVTIVWIASQITDEHRAALDWLNEITERDIDFFGLELELWRIGGSTPAPKFNVVSKPNDWARTSHAAQRNSASNPLTDTKILQKEFFEGLNEFILKTGGPIRPRTARPQHWQNYSIGRTGFRLIASVNSRDRTLRSELFMSGDEAKAHFSLLAAEAAIIEEEFGAKLDWDSLPNKIGARISVTRPNADFTKTTEWPAYHTWMADKLTKLHNTFSARIRGLSAEDLDIDEEGAA